MPTEDDIISEQMGLNVVASRIKYREFFHLKNLYKYMHEWLINEEWGSHTDKNWDENFMLSSQRQDGEQVSWWWRMHKFREAKELPLVKRILDINVDCLYIKNVEKIIKGQKVKGNTGQFDMRIYGRLIWDPGNKWKKHWFLKNFRDFYIKRWQKPFFDQKKLEMYRDVYKFQTTVKNYFQLYHAQEPHRTFKPIKGVPQTVEEPTIVSE